MLTIPTFSAIIEAHKRINPYIHQTPVLSSSGINRIIGCEIYFKCENFQKVGAFKFRGASHAITQLTKEEAQKGVATHSSGNHAAALALAAKNQNIDSYIVMPRTAPEIKKKAVAEYEANITFCEPTLEARESTLEKVQQETGAIFIHPYDNYHVICGQATAAKELLEEIRNLEMIMAPVGGGGLLSGTSISAKSIHPQIEVIAGEPAMADDAYRSFKSGRLVPSVNPKTIADGLLTSLSELTFSIIKKNVDDILLASEKNIVEAMKLVWERMKIIIEPSAAVPLAALMQNKQRFKNKKVGIILSGGNVELTRLPF